jgi:hypothetical protein
MSAKVIPYHEIQWSETIPFMPHIESGQVIKVYDGDDSLCFTLFVFNLAKYKSTNVATYCLLYLYSVIVWFIPCVSVH